jgi:TatA/E family protein of Tat protein translocase
MGFGITELIIILAIALLFFGGKRLRNLGSDLGSGIKGFKKAMKDSDTEASKTDDEVVDAEIVDDKEKN